jgi:DNA-binding IclR family transcriptional regulator
MEQGFISDDVVRFIVDKVDSVPHLEALLLLFASTPKSWSAAEIAARTYVSEERARALLQDLSRQRLAQPDADAPERYRYDAAWDVAGTTMRQVAGSYQRHLVRVANLIHSKASPAVRDFARAFQFKKKDS